MMIKNNIIITKSLSRMIYAFNRDDNFTWSLVMNYFIFQTIADGLLSYFIDVAGYVNRVTVDHAAALRRTASMLNLFARLYPLMCNARIKEYC